MSHFSSLDGWEVVGLLGAAIYCTTYMLVAFDVVTSKKTCYYALQFTAAGFVALSLTVHFNVASLTIQLFFMLVSVFGFANHLKGQSTGSADEQAL
ncbi:CBU_0592 family membrane protein [Aliiroseovarius sp. 2305UL8-7]|uniref:CBU_0592 family membrane protein n=1 Tax=Aliiroseovarius conchicola TaxID=3121637 RepID=UPI0035283758